MIWIYIDVKALYTISSCSTIEAFYMCLYFRAIFQGMYYIHLSTLFDNDFDIISSILISIENTIENKAFSVYIHQVIYWKWNDKNNYCNNKYNGDSMLSGNLFACSDIIIVIVDW